MTRSRPKMNQKNPPGQIIPSSIPYGPGMGQIKYLRDMVKKYHEEGGYKAFEPLPATLPSTSAEKRSERLLGGLKRLCEDARSYQDMVAPWDVERLIDEYEKD